MVRSVRVPVRFDAMWLLSRKGSIYHLRLSSEVRARCLLRGARGVCAPPLRAAFYPPGYSGINSSQGYSGINSHAYTNGLLESLEGRTTGCAAG